MKKLTATLLMMAGAVMLSTTVFAASESAVPTFEFLDADRDGYISTEEAATYKDLASVFEKIDVNKDGKLDQTEYAAFSQSAEQTEQKG
jgi:Ca2+-binding EF-hand superfamily protein